MYESEVSRTHAVLVSGVVKRLCKFNVFGLDMIQSYGQICCEGEVMCRECLCLIIKSVV